MKAEVYQQNPDLIRELYAELSRETIGKKPQSIVSSFATQLVSEGSWHLIALNRGHKSPLGSTLLSEETQPDKTDPQLRKTAETQIYYGNALLSLEDMLSSGTYNNEDFISRMNMSIGSVAGNKFIIEPDKRNVSLDRQKYKASIELAEKDKTLSIFFEHDKWCLPDEMRETLIEGKILQEVVIMACEYKPVLQELINIKNGIVLVKDVPQQVATLLEFDNMIKNLPNR